MFWKYNTTSSSQIDTLLAKEGVTLHEVMESEDIISECRAQNKNLIDFLLRPEVIEELVTLTTKEPSIILSENVRFKYPNIASELLTCDVPAVNERLAGDKSLLEKLYEFLESEPPLNPLLASYFSKIIGGLVAKKTEQNWLSYQLTCLQVLDFLKGRDTFLPLLLKHLGTSAIMDLMLKLMTQDEGVEMRQNILNWLDSQNIIQQLVCLLNPQVEKERHDNVAQLLCDFLVAARENQRIFDPDPLLKTLESPETIKLLLDQLFENEKCESSIVGGIAVLLSLFQTNPPSWMGFRTNKFLNETYDANINKEAADLEHKQMVRNNIVEAVTLRLKDFHDLLLNPPKKSPILTTVGRLEPPLGNTRLQVVRLLAVLIPSGHDQLHGQLISLGTFQVMLDLFFQYPWNNFLHTQVENCLVVALDVGSGEESQITTLRKHLIGTCSLVETVMKAWKENDKQQSETKAIRQGYMGHLISIVNHIVKLTQETQLGDQLKELKPDTFADLEEFKAAQLAEVMEKQEKLLGGLHPNAISDDNDDFDDIPFPQSNALQQQSFCQYQMQNLPSVIDGYSGFNDDAFNDGDETLQTIDNQLDVNFDVSEAEMMQRDAIFKQLCAQSINTLFDADDTVFEERDHTFQTVIEKKDQADGAENSSDSDDEKPSGPDDSMEVDPCFGVAGALSALSIPAWTSPKADPWGASGMSENATNWADFSSATFESSTIPFQASFPETAAADKAANMEETKVENTAASGDHPHNKTAENQSCSSQLSSSISVEGDACKTPTEKSPGKPPTTDEQV